MPKSKRDKKVSLTKTKKHGKDWKKNLIRDFKDAVEEKGVSVYVFKADGMRGNGLRLLRQTWRPSTIFLGKNNLIRIVFGKDEASEVKDQIHKLSDRLKGNCGVLITMKSEKEVVDFFNAYKTTDFAKAGFVPKETIVLDEGPLNQFPHSIEPHLRSLGLATSLKKGIVNLVKDFTVCTKGTPITSEQAKILKLLEMPLAEYSIKLDSMWTEPGIIKILAPEVEESGEVLDENMDMQELQDDDDDSIGDLSTEEDE